MLNFNSYRLKDFLCFYKIGIRSFSSITFSQISGYNYKLNKILFNRYIKFLRTQMNEIYNIII